MMSRVTPWETDPRTSHSAKGSGGVLECDLTNEIEFLVARATSLGKALANARLAPLDLRVRSYSVLASVCGADGLSQRDIAEFLCLDPSQIVALVDGLERRALLERLPDPRDRRTKLIRATAAGRKLHAQAADIVRDAEDESLQNLSTAERDQLRELLRRMAFPV